MTEQNLLARVESILTRLGKLVVEVKSHKLNGESNQSQAKVEKLERLIVKHLSANEIELLIFRHAIIEGPVTVYCFILKLMATRLGKTKYFDKVNEHVNNAARYLTQSPLQLSHDSAVNIVKFGYLVEIEKRMIAQDLNKKWFDSFKFYLENCCQFDCAKAKNIVNATEPLACKLGETFWPGMIGVLYYYKLCKEINFQLLVSSGEMELDLDFFYELHQENYGPIIKHMKVIGKLVKEEDVKQLKLAMEEFNKCLEQDYDASPEEIFEIRLALEEHFEEFEWCCFAFIEKRY